MKLPALSKRRFRAWRSHAAGWCWTVVVLLLGVVVTILGPLDFVAVDPSPLRFLRWEVPWATSTSSSSSSPSWQPLFLSCCEAKVTTGTFHFRHRQPQYLLGSFAVVPDGALVTVTVQSKEEYPDNAAGLWIHTYRDSPNWDEYHTEKYCDSKATHSNYKYPVRFEYDNVTDQWQSKLSFAVLNIYATNTNRRKERYHYWYFVIDDCYVEVFENVDQTIPELSYNLSMMNTMADHWKIIKGHPETYRPPRSHWSADEMYLERTYIVATIVSFTVGISMILRWYYLTKRGGGHPASSWCKAMRSGRLSSSSFSIRNASLAVVVVGVLASAAMMGTLSTLFEVIHLDAYQYDGIGIKVYDTLATYSEAISDSIMIIFLWSVVSWTLHETSSLSLTSGEASGKTTPADKTIPIFVATTMSRSHRESSNAASREMVLSWIVVVLVHVGLAQWNRALENGPRPAHHHRGSYEADLPELILMMFHFLLSLVFYVRIRKFCSGENGCHVRTLGVVGFVWFQKLGIVTVVCNVIVPYHWWVPARAIGTYVLQSIMLVVAAWFALAMTTTNKGSSPSSFISSNHPPPSSIREHHSSLLTECLLASSPTVLAKAVFSSVTTASSSSPSSSGKISSKTLLLGNPWGGSGSSDKRTTEE